MDWQWWDSIAALVWRFLDGVLWFYGRKRKESAWRTYPALRTSFIMSHDGSPITKKEEWIERSNEGPENES
jgi:hypothetical protein